METALVEGLREAINGYERVVKIWQDYSRKQKDDNEMLWQMYTALASAVIRHGQETKDKKLLSIVSDSLSGGVLMIRSILEQDEQSLNGVKDENQQKESECN